MSGDKTILFLTKEEVITCGGGNVKLAGPDIQRGFELLLQDKIIQPWKTTLKVKHSGHEHGTGLVNFLPSYVNFDGEEIYCCKSLGAMPSNVEIGMPRATGLITLFDPHTKSPLCVMDAQVISATRTGAVSMLAAKRLARMDIEEVGLVGAGVNMKTQLWGLVYALPNLKRARVYSRKDSKYIFAEEMGEITGIEIIPVNTAREAVEGCSMVVTCLPNVGSPVVKAEWVNEKGITVFNIGCYESEAILLARMDRVVADIWEQGKHRGIQTHAIAVAQGVIPESRVEDVGPIIAGLVPGRQYNDENIFFAPTGLGFEDAVVAWRVYKEAEKRGIGTKLTLWKSSSGVTEAELSNNNVRTKLEEAPCQKLKRINKECKEIEKYDSFEDGRLKISSLPIPMYTVPYVFNKNSVMNILKKLDIFIEAIIKLEKYALNNKGGKIYKRLINSLTPGGRYLVEQCSFESEYSLRRRNRRIDGYFDVGTGNYSIIEINQAAPLALHCYDISQRVAVHFLNSIGFYYEPIILANHILDWFVGEYNERNPGKFPANIALVIEHGYYMKFTDLPGMARICEELALRRYGEKMTIKPCFPYDIKLSGDKIYLDGTEINMIWRNSVYMTKYREEGYDIKDYEEICSNPDKYLIINSTRSWLTRTKEVFALFWDDECCKNLRLSFEEIEFIRELIPPSLNLKYRPDMFDEILKEKELWITKPSDAGFGKGVEFGTNHSRDDWEKIMIERAENEGFVFQRRIIYPESEILDIDNDGSVLHNNVEFDFCPHHVNGKFTGTILARSNIIKQNNNILKMNIASGATIIPIILL